MAISFSREFSDKALGVSKKRINFENTSPTANNYDVSVFCISRMSSTPIEKAALEASVALIGYYSFRAAKLAMSYSVVR